MLGPFSERWNTINSKSCDYVELGTNSAPIDAFEKTAAVELCGVTNVVNTSNIGVAPISAPYWLTVAPPASGSAEPTAVHMGFRSTSGGAFDRSITVDANLTNDTKVVGLPAMAIPVYFAQSGALQTGDFLSTDIRILDRLTTSIRAVTYTQDAATLELDVVNQSGFTVSSFVASCEGEGDKLRVSSTTPKFRVSPIVPGVSYKCRATAFTIAGQSEASAPSTILGATAPSSPKIVSTDYEDGAIILTVTADDNGAAITRYDATCTDGTNTFSAYTGTSATSPITVYGLTNDIAYTCTVTATNAVGTSQSSARTEPIIPEELPTGLPIWLLYEATIQNGTCPNVTIIELATSSLITIPDDIKPTNDANESAVLSGCAMLDPRITQGSQLALGVMAALLSNDPTQMILIAGLGNPDALPVSSRRIEIGTYTTDGQIKLQNMGAGYSGDCREIIGDAVAIAPHLVVTFFNKSIDSVFCARLKAVNGNEILIRASWGQAAQSFTAASITWVNNN